MFSKAKQTLAKAKLVKSKIPELYKLVIAFNVTEISKNGSYKFPVQKSCDYVSGDISLEDLHNTLAVASKVLRTNNIQIVE
jgi:hypothetical protein